MEQPLLKQAKPQHQMNNQTPPPPPSAPTRKRKLPTPQELVAHYESQGMDNQQASLKVIEDLQKVVFRMVTTTSKNKSNGGDDTSRKLEIINSRLLSLDMKVDSKPGYPQTLAIGVAAGALLQSATTVLPRVVSGVSQIWRSVGRAANAGVSTE